MKIWGDNCFLVNTNFTIALKLYKLALAIKVVYPFPSLTYASKANPLHVRGQTSTVEGIRKLFWVES